jgi:uncharacterized membrane protein YgaE (UPF0421/DUF939 family)
MTPLALLHYLAKCLTGSSIIFLLAHVFDYHDIRWALISLVLVLTPDSKEAIPLALTQIKSNAVAGLACLFCLLFGPATPVSISVAFILTITFCTVLRLTAGYRSALAAVIIIMLHTDGIYHWNTALAREVSVIFGCSLGLLITFIYHRKLRDVREPEPLANLED